MLGGPETERNAARAHGCRVAPGGVPDHDRRMIDATDEPLRRPAAEFADAIPGPKPISGTWSVGSTPRRPTAHTLRWRFDDWSAISHPTSHPAPPAFA
jgi:hypothetical protein